MLNKNNKIPNETMNVTIIIICNSKITITNSHIILNNIVEGNIMQTNIKTKDKITNNIEVKNKKLLITIIEIKMKFKRTLISDMQTNNLQHKYIEQLMLVNQKILKETGLPVECKNDYQ